MSVRRTASLLALLPTLAIPLVSAAADLEVEQLRRDVHELERMVRAQARRIDDLERALGRRALAPPAADALPEDPPPARENAWLAPDRWRELAAGMTSAEVIEALGPPTGVRPGDDPNERVMLYTLELDAGAFLSGSVRVANDRVVGIERPALK